MRARYDGIGINYSELRLPDRRITSAIKQALGHAKNILNVGAGTGSYESSDQAVTAVEPSGEMIRQRKPGPASVVQTTAENLPFGDGTFDAAMAVLTVHHWDDPSIGLREVRRVTRGPIVLLTFQPSFHPWLTDYLPQLAALDDDRMPTMNQYQKWLGNIEVTPVPIPHDCSNGFLPFKLAITFPTSAQS